MTKAHKIFDRAIAVLYFRNLQLLDLIPEDLIFSEFESNFQCEYDREKNSFSIEIDDTKLGIKFNEPLPDSIHPTEEDIEELKKHIDIDKVAGEKLLHEWKKHAPELLKKERKVFSDFLGELSEIWREPLELLEILLSTTLDKGIEYNEVYCKTQVEESQIIFHVVNKMFGRICQVGKEIHVLLSHGFADGAEARWRTLYELVVVASFIMRNDSDVSKRYIAHEVYDTHKAMKSYHDKWLEEGIEKVTKNELEEIKSQLDDYIKVFGKNFNSDYGWAAKALGKTEKRKITFSDIEQSVKYDYLRPLYQEANSNIHATSRGAVIRLGLPNPTDGILVSYSLFGISEIIVNTSFLIVAFLENMLIADPVIQNRVHIEAVYMLLDEIRDTSFLVEKTLIGKTEDPQEPEQSEKPPEGD